MSNDVKLPHFRILSQSQGLVLHPRIFIRTSRTIYFKSYIFEILCRNAAQIRRKQLPIELSVANHIMRLANSYKRQNTEGVKARDDVRNSQDISDFCTDTIGATCVWLFPSSLSSFPARTSVRCYIFSSYNPQCLSLPEAFSGNNYHQTTTTIILIIGELGHG